MAEAYLGQIKDLVLGRDFLTWLWFRSETADGAFRAHSGEAFSLHVEQRVSVQGGEGDTLETAVVSGMLSELREAKLGLASGKKVVKALIRLECDPDVWQLNLKAEDLSIAGLKTPKIEAQSDEDDDPDAVILEKLYLIERALAFLDDAFAEFIRLRVGPQWAEEKSAVARWLSQEEA
jgi:hypothetical protein